MVSVTSVPSKYIFEYTEPVDSWVINTWCQVFKEQAVLALTYLVAATYKPSLPSVCILKWPSLSPLEVVNDHTVFG
jgi:hypothetical protein